jgi:ABC-type multidrug transport system fused ATPase/permease subunit
MNFKLGLATPVTSEGLNLPKGMIRKIMFARSIISKPKILILDQAFEGVAQKDKISIINSLYSNRDWTILDITMDSDIILKSKRVITLEKGLIVEEGTPEELAKKKSLFAELFPGLVLYFSKGV